jgi:hypothetical protein
LGHTFIEFHRESTISLLQHNSFKANAPFCLLLSNVYGPLIGRLSLNYYGNKVLIYGEMNIQNDSANKSSVSMDRNEIIDY